jgi:hypothetical protein
MYVVASWAPFRKMLWADTRNELTRSSLNEEPWGF